MKTSFKNKFLTSIKSSAVLKRFKKNYFPHSDTEAGRSLLELKFVQTENFTLELLYIFLVEDDGGNARNEIWM